MVTNIYKNHGNIGENYICFSSQLSTQVSSELLRDAIAVERKQMENFNKVDEFSYLRLEVTYGIRRTKPTRRPRLGQHRLVLLLMYDQTLNIPDYGNGKPPI